mmetsp:Transcript_29377/g.94280  ORF Transcript_29377/g.94280 Transcript_29377/m.94280 type:complete len:319 (+) Transcript_29377:1484-2440(+)
MVQPHDAGDGEAAAGLGRPRPHALPEDARGPLPAPGPRDQCHVQLHPRDAAERQRVHRLRRDAQFVRDPRAVVHRLHADDAHLLHPVTGRERRGRPRPPRGQVRVREGRLLPQRVHGPGPGRRGHGEPRHGAPQRPLGHPQQHPPHAEVAERAGEASRHLHRGGQPPEVPSLRVLGPVEQHPDRHPQPLHQAHQRAAGWPQGQPEARVRVVLARADRGGGQQAEEHHLRPLPFPRHHDRAQDVRPDGLQHEVPLRHRRPDQQLRVPCELHGELRRRQDSVGGSQVHLRRDHVRWPHRERQRSPPRQLLPGLLHEGRAA